MSTVKNLTPCPHIAELRSKQGPNPFGALQDCLRAKPMGRASIRCDPSEVPHCGACGTAATPRPRLYACLACAAVHCHVPETRASHAAAHAASMPPGHEIAVDVDRAELFCCRCCDQIYDQDFDAAVVSAAVGNLSQLQQSRSRSESVRKRRRIEYQSWVPDLEERILIGGNSRLLTPPAMDPNEDPAVSLNQGGAGLGGFGSVFPWGLRGLSNLGSTCFMSSVLQALLHTPPLRNYFLSDKHNRYLCHKSRNNDAGGGTRKSSSNKGGSGSEHPNSLCLVCDLDAIFSAAFSGDRTPYSPAKFLYSWWQHAANLATYEQQDAHEFFISILDGIHEKVQDVHKSHSQGSGDCCIAHRVFSGILRSDVMCTACGFTSTTFDPCVDISLDLEPHMPQKKKAAAPKRSKKAGSNTATTDPCSSPAMPQETLSTLTGCLDRFTRPERLGPDQKFFCQQCQIKQESMKQLSIRKLPLVSCFHIKRFEHSSLKNMSKKVDRYLQFPFSLDMAPYLSSSILRARFGNRIFAFDDGEEEQQDGGGGGLSSSAADSSSSSSSKFELFAVITHSGKLNAGHYVTYLRLSNEWYKCDDAWITRVSESIVRAAEGYMMFYVQKMLYYRPTAGTTDVKAEK